MPKEATVKELFLQTFFWERDAIKAVRKPKECVCVQCSSVTSLCSLRNMSLSFWMLPTWGTGFPCSMH